MVAVRILDVLRVVLVIVVRIVVISGVVRLVVVVRIGLGLGCESCTSRGG